MDEKLNEIVLEVVAHVLLAFDFLHVFNGHTTLAFVDVVGVPILPDDLHFSQHCEYSANEVMKVAFENESNVVSVAGCNHSIFKIGGRGRIRMKRFTLPRCNI